MTLTKFRNIVVLTTIIVATFGLGYQSGISRQTYKNQSSKGNITGRDSSKVGAVDFSLFWTVWDKLDYYYLDKSAIDPQKMVYGAISGMVASLGDPYTVFLPPDQNKETKDDLSGKFEGIGAQLGVKDKKIVIVAPLKGAPAEEAGLKSGDWIIKVDGKDTVNWTLPETVSKIRGPSGSRVTLSIIHKDSLRPEEIAVVRGEIKVASVEWAVKKVKCENESQSCVVDDTCNGCKQVLHLKLGRFGDRTNEEWVKAVDEVSDFYNKNKLTVAGLILDLRNNPGGYLTGSVFIASEFLTDGAVVIQENYQGNKQTYNVNRKGRLYDIPMVVLINKGSASASEIVAGALKSRGRAKLVGENSFGKGSIQEAMDLSSGSGIHITTAKWLLPNGKWINGDGIEPDIKIENDENKPDSDLQLLKASETLVR